MELPQLFPTTIRTWFDDVCDPKNMQRQPKGQAASCGYRKAPPVTPQRFALPHQVGEAIRSVVPADRLPPLNKTTLRDASPSMNDVMEVRMSCCHQQGCRHAPIYWPYPSSCIHATHKPSMDQQDSMACPPFFQFGGFPPDERPPPPKI